MKVAYETQIEDLEKQINILKTKLDGKEQTISLLYNLLKEILDKISFWGTK